MCIHIFHFSHPYREPGRQPRQVISLYDIPVSSTLREVVDAEREYCYLVLTAVNVVLSVLLSLECRLCSAKVSFFFIDKRRRPPPPEKNGNIDVMSTGW